MGPVTSKWALRSRYVCAPAVAVSCAERRGPPAGPCPGPPALAAAPPVCTSVVTAARAVPSGGGGGPPPAPRGGPILAGFYFPTRPEVYGAAAPAGRRITLVVL